MPHKLNVSEDSVLGSNKYLYNGRTECVAFVQQTTDLGLTEAWQRGIKVSDAPPGSIARGTAIATFDTGGHYPTDGNGKHAAIYLSHDATGILVLDQWASQGEVKERRIRYGGVKRSNDAATFYVIK